MKHQLSKLMMQFPREPTLLTIKNCERPMNHRIRLIIFAGQTRQIKRPVQRIARRSGGPPCRSRGDETDSFVFKVRDSSRRPLQIFSFLPTVPFNEIEDFFWCARHWWRLGDDLHGVQADFPPVFDVSISQHRPKAKPENLFGESTWHDWPLRRHAFETDLLAQARARARSARWRNGEKINARRRSRVDSNYDLGNIGR